MPYLLALSIGPVQEFIAAARKTRDLWFGSELLSRTARAAALTLQEQGARLIFPAPESLQDEEYVPVPNKIVANTDDAPSTLVEQARVAAQGYLREQRAAAEQYAHRRGGDRLVNWTLVDEQLADFLEFYAAWWRYDSEAGYDEARQNADALLAGRKALRDFKPSQGHDGVPKSMLDGGRETVIIRPNRLDDKGLRRLDMKRAELLDGVSLIKRLADQRRFVSVSRIAIDPLIRRLNASDKPRLETLNRIAADLAGRSNSQFVQRIPVALSGLEHFDPFPYDTELFYDNGAREDAAEDDEKELGLRFYEAVRNKGGSEPPPYLAVLVADGDHVGAAISHMGSSDKHRAFSRLGSDFAREADEIVAGHNGALVYSGGDDVLAFLPLDRVLGCADELRQKFTEAMKNQELSLGDKAPTLSVGVAISHFNDPLRDLLKRGRDAEGAAKRTKNTLAVALHVRAGGGAAVTTARSWADNPLRHWERWVRWYRCDKIPDGAAYELRQLARELRRLADKGHAAEARALVPAEVERILKRKRGGHGTRSLASLDIEIILRMLRTPKADGTATTKAATVVAEEAGQEREEDELDRLETLVDELIIARHIARVRDVAEGRLVAGKGECA